MTPIEAILAPLPGIEVEFLLPQPPAGAPGVSGGSYQHDQAVASALWTVNHNLGYRPAVSVLTVGGVQMLAEVIHASANQALVYFDTPTAGLAVCS